MGHNWIAVTDLRVYKTYDKCNDATRQLHLLLRQGCVTVCYMPARILPPTSRLRHLVEQGMTHKEIAELVTRETGYPVSRSTVSAALHRSGDSKAAKKYPQEIPWTVKEEHQTHYAARMLRLLGRRRQGVTNSAEADSRLDAWLRQLSEAGAVVVYVPDTDDGFFYIQGVPYMQGIPVQLELVG